MVSANPCSCKSRSASRTGEHEDLFRLIEDKNEKGLEEALKEHLYYSMKRMRRSIEVDYKDYFEEEDEEGRFVI